MTDQTLPSFDPETPSQETPAPRKPRPRPQRKRPAKKAAKRAVLPAPKRVPKKRRVRKTIRPIAFEKQSKPVAHLTVLIRTAGEISKLLLAILPEERKAVIEASFAMLP